MTVRDRAEIELYKTRFVLMYLRDQVYQKEQEMLRLMKRLDIDTNEDGDLPRPIHCTNCGYKMVDADELATIAGQWTCHECYTEFILQVDGIDLNTEEGKAEHKAISEEMTSEEQIAWKEKYAL